MLPRFSKIDGPKNWIFVSHVLVNGGIETKILKISNANWLRLSVLVLSRCTQTAEEFSAILSAKGMCSTRKVPCTDCGERWKNQSISSCYVMRNCLLTWNVLTEENQQIFENWTSKVLKPYATICTVRPNSSWTGFYSCILCRKRLQRGEVVMVFIHLAKKCSWDILDPREMNYQGNVKKCITNASIFLCFFDRAS
jgi:hypothetical protein